MAIKWAARISIGHCGIERGVMIAIGSLPLR